MKIKRDTLEFEKEVSKLVTEFVKSGCRIEPKQCRVLGVAHLEKEQFKQPERILCPRCGSKDVWKFGIRGGVQYYFCEKCKRKFTAKDAPFHMQSSADQIGASLNMFYDGMSVADIARHLSETYHNPVNASTVYRWIVRYTKEAIDLLSLLKPQGCQTWVVDETVVRVNGRNTWYWDVLCLDSRMLIGSHLSSTRTMKDVMTVMQSARDRTGKPPRFIISDSLGVYPDGIERVFGSESKHIKSWGMSEKLNNNVIERFHGSIKERTKVMRGLKTMQTGRLILDGFGIHYDFFKPHMTFVRTPAEVAGIKAPFQNWTELVKGTKTVSCIISGKGKKICSLQNPKTERFCKGEVCRYGKS